MFKGITEYFRDQFEFKIFGMRLSEVLRLLTAY